MGLFEKSVPEPAQTPAYDTHRPLTASASKIDIKSKNELECLQNTRAKATWQADAWEYEKAVPCINFASRLIRSVTSRVRYYPAYISNPNEPPTFVGDKALDLSEDLVAVCNRALDRLSNTPGGLAGLGSRIAANLWVAGEGTLVEFAPSPKNNMQATWKFLSVSELVITGKKISYKPNKDSKATEDLSGSTFFARIWSADPRFADDAESSIQCVQGACDELLGYARLRKTLTHSRMNAGALLIPDSLASTEVQTQDTSPNFEDFDGDFDPASVIQDLPDSEADDFEEELIAAMTAPIADPSSGSTIVPFVIKGPKEELGAVRYLTFDREIDEQLNASADRALAAIRQGLDIPEDMTNSQQGVRYSNRQATDSQFYKNHIEPLVVAICDALTTVYLRPILLAYGVDPAIVEKIVWWFDPSEILTQADRSQSANDGYDRGILSDKAWREAYGYPETSAPDGTEKLLKAALGRGQITEPIFELLLNTLIPGFTAQLRDVSQASSPAPLPDRAREILGFDTAPTPAKDEAQAPAAPPVPEPSKRNLNPLPNGSPNPDEGVI